jgi:phenylalanyl-tRNA synthetase beta chain
MKLPLNWLKEYVEVNIPAEKLAEKLTMTGLEVESIESPVDFSKVVIGEVLEREKHPNADKLNVAKVNVGNEVLQIVCGAPNLNVGQKVAVALVGAKLGDFEIAKRELRGVTSHGMICSEKELSLGEDHNGIMVLEKNAPIGDDFAKY